MEDNTLKIEIDRMMGGLNGMVSVLEKTVKDSFSGMGKEQAIEFAKALNDAKVHEKVEEIKESSKKLKSELNID